MLSDPNIKTIVMSFYGVRNVNGDVLGDTSRAFKVLRWNGASSEIVGLEDIFKRSLDNTLSVLTKSGKEIIFILDWPELGFDIRSCIDSRAFPLAKTKNQCRIQKQAYLDRAANYRGAVREILSRYPNVRIFDTSRYLCDDEYCYAKLKDKLLYIDSHHLSESGSRYLGEQFLHFIDR